MGWDAYFYFCSKHNCIGPPWKLQAGQTHSPPSIATRRRALIEVRYLSSRSWKGKKTQTKFPIEVRTLKQERETDDDPATMRESFSLVQKILFGAFGATSFLGWSCFPGDSNMCCFGRRSDCNTLGIIHREEHGFWEHCKIYTCWKFENHSFPLVCYTAYNIYQFGKFIWRKMTNEKAGLTTMLQCQSVKMSWRHNL